ncbi:MAG TPA: nitrilase-related carbon-nitrogen hydrolase, partial [Pirellulales bacterium]|nr:nitrilase-related carbon-nitrogen hydrolase [Pirellulales bacterium]
MKLIKVAAAVLNQTPLDWDGNKARILAAIEAARAARVTLLCLPELCITGYGCEDAFLSPGLQRTALEVLSEIVPETHGMIVSLGLPLLYHHGLFDVACLATDGQILGFTAKRFLAGDGIHYEPRWFKPWPAGHRGQVTCAGRDYPVGDIHYDCGGLKIGFEICEDAWVANRPGSELALRGVDVILNPSASHFAFGKAEIRHRFVLEGSRAFGVSYVYSNLLGNEAGRAIYDGGALVASGGKLLAAGPRFSFADFQLTSALIDVDATRMVQSRTGSFLPSVETETDCLRAAFAFPALVPEAEATPIAGWERGAFVKEEEFARAISLALFDYLRKSRSRGFVVSISGGVDSAAVSCLAAMGLELAWDELGSEGITRKLSYWPAAGETSSLAELIQRLLTCVYQTTCNSSQTTRDAAHGVATAIGAQFLEWNVDELVQKYTAIVSQAIGRELDWQCDDLALQNIQARVRSPGVWLLANLRGALLLSTSNRSEAAVGYATMDGDTSGGLSPIAGIDKAFLRRWLVWLQERGLDGLRPVSSLAAVNCQAPTAELRPLARCQTDEDDLMPYELLDEIERAAIRDKYTPLEVLLRVRARFTQYTVEQLAFWVERFFRLWCRNQWKRERYAPSFHVDDENLDPKTWCRFHILSGGFERELAELRQYVTGGFRVQG